jgi:DNA-binding PadR family transcriptional regulator
MRFHGSMLVSTSRSVCAQGSSARRVRISSSVSASTTNYTEPKRLAKLGYLSARKEPGKTRERTVYALTDKGLDALHSYAETAVALMPVKSDALLRLLICDLVGEDVTRRSMTTLRDDIADVHARLDDAEQRAHRLPHREKYLLIVVGFLRRLLELHEELVDEVERELAI